MIIGLTGRNCAGKGTVAEYLKKKSFYYYSLSDVIREELVLEGKEITRDALIAKGNSLREKEGPSVLATRFIGKMKRDRNYVVDSIRNPAEVEALKNQQNFFLFVIDAPVELRFERAKQRGRYGDEIKTLETFKDIEERELKSVDKTRQNLLACEKMADKVILNDGDLEVLYDRINEALAQVSAEFKLVRPSWDDYFMSIAKTASTRSNCMKRQIASVIVRDKRIVTTGYNGTPRGTRNCSEGGCLRCNSFADGSTKLDECLCSHAEENAIVQAAYHGVALKGSTLYVTFSPCLTCAKMIINAGIIEVVYNEDYPLSEVASNLMKEAGVLLRKHKV